MLEKRKILRKTKENLIKPNGITLMVLIITIIILLILAGITVTTLTGDNGLIKNAINAKEETEISNEKEVVDTAILKALENNKSGILVNEELQNELDKITGDGKTEVIEGGYLDIGNIDTMEDLIVNFIGALTFSVLGFFYITNRDNYRFTEQFIVRRKHKKNENNSLS